MLTMAKNNLAPFPPELPSGDGIATTCYSKLWREDDLDVTDKVVSVFRFDPGDSMWHPLPLTITTNRGGMVEGESGWQWKDVAVSMKDVRESVMHLAEKGGPCWPGHIAPLEPGGHYLVTISEDRQHAEFESLAVVSRGNDKILP